MNGGMLSQDEIDALLSGGKQEDQAVPFQDTIITDYLSEMEQDALGEIGNISFGSSATALSTLLNQKVQITTPALSIIDREKLNDEFPDPYVAIQVKYTVGFSGVNILVIKQTDAAIIADLMLGGDGTSPEAMLDEIRLSAVQEAMNQMMGSAATSMSALFNKRVDISPPTIDLLNVSLGEGTDKIPEQNLLVKVSFHLRIGTLINSGIMQVLTIDFARSLVDQLLAPNVGESEEKVMKETPKEQSIIVDPDSKQSEPYTQPMSDSLLMQGDQIDTSRSHRHHSNIHMQKTNVQPASFSELNPSVIETSDTKNLGMLLDIPLQVTVELGRTSRTVKEILELGSGSIIELDKLAGEPVDILINNRYVAKGEVVVIDENFGVRVTNISSHSERLQKLK